MAMTDLLEIQEPANPRMGAPGSPAMSREQIKNKSSRGWSGANGMTTTAAAFAPLAFKGNQQVTQGINGVASASMYLNPSTDSTISTIDGGSPFGSILDKFEAPVRENTRKTSASFKILGKNAVSNSPFLNGGNTSTSSPSYSPTHVRKPFSPVEGSYNNFRHSDSNWSGAHIAGNAPPSPGRNGLGLLSRSTPISQASPASASSNQFPSRIPHKRNNSDAENQNPGNSAYLSVTKKGEVVSLSPATQFNAEMNAIGAPPAMNVTYSSEGDTPDLQNAEEVAAFRPRKAPRASIASLGNRGAVSSSPFLQQESPMSGHTLGHRPTSSISSVTSYSSASSSPYNQFNSPSTSHSALAMPRRGSKQMLGPREPSYTDLRAQTLSHDQDAVEQLADEYDQDTPIQALTEANLDRKASKKSVKWAEVEEVCEFDVETEEGESRRSSAASTNSLIIDDYGSTDEDTDGEQNNIIQQAIAKAEDLRYNDSEQSRATYYDDYRHSSSLAEEAEDITVHASNVENKSPEPSRDASAHSEPAGLIEHPVNSTISSVEDEDELQKLIRKVEGDVLDSRSDSHLNEDDVFGRDFGINRTPKSSHGSSGLGSETSTPQALNFGSASRRPLPPPPVPISISPASPQDVITVEQIRAAASYSTMYLKTGESEWDLPELDLHNSPLLSAAEMNLVRKESLKQAPPSLVAKSHSPSTLAQEIIPNAAAVPVHNHDDVENLPIERATSPRPRLTANEVRESLRKRPGSSFPGLGVAQPLASTPPSGAAITSKSALPNIDNIAGQSRGSHSKAISARPASQPIKISSEELPTLRSTKTTSMLPSPTKVAVANSHESPLDRLAREASTGNTLQAPSMGRGRSNSTSSSTSVLSFHSADSQHSDGKLALKKRDEALLAAKRKKRDASPNRPSGRRRSLSTGDTDLKQLRARKEDDIIVIPQSNPTTLDSKPLPPTTPLKPSALESHKASKQEDAFGLQMDRALDNVVDSHDRGYRIRERERGPIAYSGPDDDKVSTIGSAGDIDAGKAWRKVRRASDIHEHRTHLKEYKQNSASIKEKKTGAIFIKVGKLTLNKHVPIPTQPTYVICELDNGRQLVTTPAVQLKREKGKEQEQITALIAQEFELIADPDLEITLSFKIRRDQRSDSHLFPQASIAPFVSPSKHSHSNSASSGFRAGLRSFLSSPKKVTKTRHLSQMDISTSRPSTPQPNEPIPSILQHLSDNGEIARVVIKASTHIPKCTGQKVSIIQECTPALGASLGLRRIAEIGLQIFHLPPMAEVPHDQMPQSIEECVIGLEQAEKYEKLMFEGPLTQQGADCPMWRRRQMRLQGSRMIAFNDITRKAYAIIHLAQAVSLEDPEEEEPSTSANSAAKSSTPASTTPLCERPNHPQHRRTLSMEDADDPFSSRPHSFRLVFQDGSHIDFFADDGKAKATWVRMLKPIIRGGKNARSTGVPPLWAQLMKASNTDKDNASTS